MVTATSDIHVHQTSVVARQSPSAVLSTFTTPSGYDVLLLYTERLTMDVSYTHSSMGMKLMNAHPLPNSHSQEVFSKEHASNKALTWVLRAVGALLMFVGFNITTGILITLCKYNTSRQSWCCI